MNYTLNEDGICDHLYLRDFNLNNLKLDLEKSWNACNTYWCNTVNSRLSKMDYHSFDEWFSKFKDYKSNDKDILKEVLKESWEANSVLNTNSFTKSTELNYSDFNEWFNLHYEV